MYIEIKIRRIEQSPNYATNNLQNQKQCGIGENNKKIQEKRNIARQAKWVIGESEADLPNATPKNHS